MNQSSEKYDVVVFKVLTRANRALTLNELVYEVTGKIAFIHTLSKEESIKLSITRASLSLEKKGLIMVESINGAKRYSSNFIFRNIEYIPGDSCNPSVKTTSKYSATAANEEDFEVFCENNYNQLCARGIIDNSCTFNKLTSYGFHDRDEKCMALLFESALNEKHISLSKSPRNKCNVTRFFLSPSSELHVKLKPVNGCEFERSFKNLVDDMVCNQLRLHRKL